MEDGRRAIAFLRPCIFLAAASQKMACAICLEDLDADAARLPCGHQFNQACLDRWLADSRTCPVCRCSVSQPQVVVDIELVERVHHQQSFVVRWFVSLVCAMWSVVLLYFMIEWAKLH